MTAFTLDPVHAAKVTFVAVVSLVLMMTMAGNTSELLSTKGSVGKTKDPAAILNLLSVSDQDGSSEKDESREKASVDDEPEPEQKASEPEAEAPRVSGEKRSHRQPAPDAEDVFLPDLSWKRNLKLRPGLRTPLCDVEVKTVKPLRQSKGEGFCWRGTLDRENKARLRDFLPPAEELDGGDACIRCRAGIASLQELMKEGCADIDNARCAKAGEYGFGAMVNSMVKTATVALVRKQPFVWANYTSIWGGTNPMGTKPKDMKEPKIPLSAHFSKEAVPCHKKCKGSFTKIDVERDIVLRDKWPQVCAKRETCNYEQISLDTLKGEVNDIRNARTTRYEDVFWWGAELMQLLMRPNEAVAKIVEEQKRKMGFDNHESVLGVHVRMGDSCKTVKLTNSGRKCDGLDPVVPRVKQMVEKYGYKAILVVSDDEGVKRDAKKLLGKYGKVLTTTIGSPVFKDKKGDPIVIDRASFDNADKIGQDFLAESVLLSQCDGFIGKFTSNVFRNVYSLASIKPGGKYCLQPVMSLDSPFCMDYLVPVNLNCNTGAVGMC